MPSENINSKLSGGNGFAQGSRPKRFKIVEGSGALRSFIQPIHGACLSSRVTNITLYSAKKIGIWSKIGKQPLQGLPFLFYKAPSFQLVIFVYRQRRAPLFFPSLVGALSFLPSKRKTYTPKATTSFY